MKYYLVTIRGPLPLKFLDFLPALWAWPGLFPQKQHKNIIVPVFHPPWEIEINRQWPSIMYSELNIFFRGLLLVSWDKCFRIIFYTWIAQILKFIYPEKATKFCEIFTLLLSLAVPVKRKVKISQYCVAFSEYMNFINLYKNIIACWL